MSWAERSHDPSHRVAMKMEAYTDSEEIFHRKRLGQLCACHVCAETPKPFGSVANVQYDASTSGIFGLILVGRIRYRNRTQARRVTLPYLCHPMHVYARPARAKRAILSERYWCGVRKGQHRRGSHSGNPMLISGCCLVLSQ